MTHSDCDPLDAQSAIAVYSALKTRRLIPLLDEVCRRRGVISYEVCGRSRTLGVCHARHELWWLIRNHPERRYSYLELASVFQRDHSTIRYGVLAHEKRLDP